MYITNTPEGGRTSAESEEDRAMRPPCASSLRFRSVAAPVRLRRPCQFWGLSLWTQGQPGLSAGRRQVRCTQETALLAGEGPEAGDQSRQGLAGGERVAGAGRSQADSCPRARGSRAAAATAGCGRGCGPPGGRAGIRCPESPCARPWPWPGPAGSPQRSFGENPVAASCPCLCPLRKQT